MSCMNFKNIKYLNKKLTLALSISTIFFIRGKFASVSMLLPSVTYLVPFFVFIIYLQNLKRDKNFTIVPKIYKSYNYFFLIIIVNQLMNIVLKIDQYFIIIRFIFEILLNFFILMIPFILLVEKRISIEKILNLVKFTSLFGSIPILIVAYGLDSVRRIGTTDAPLPIAINHIGHALALTSIICFHSILDCFLNKANSRKILIDILIFFTSCFTALLTGSKAAIFGLVFYIILLVFLNFRKKVIIKSFVILSVLSIFFILFLISTGKFDSLLNRFSIDRILLGFSQRYKSFNSAIINVEIKELILGASWKYQLLNKSDFIIYPHNIVVSILLHTGVIPTMIFLNIIFRQLKISFKAIHSPYWLIGSTMLGLFTTIMLYALTSGRLTRIMTIFFVFGLNEGIYRLLNEKNDFP